MNRKTTWMDVISRKMENLKVTFDILHDGSKILVGHNKSSGHLVFDVLMTLERKARWVKYGHNNPEPEWSTFARVVSRENTCIAFTHAALNDVLIYACDIQNAYLQAPSSKNTMLFVVQILDQRMWVNIQ